MLRTAARILREGTRCSETGGKPWRARRTRSVRLPLCKHFSYTGGHRRCRGLLICAMWHAQLRRAALVLVASLFFTVPLTSTLSRYIALPR